VQRLASGDTSNLHEVMLGIERARMQFQLLVQVRNRVLEAYQDVLRMQV
jgi:flagellar hook-basal body complex protein FliE